MCPVFAVQCPKKLFPNKTGIFKLYTLFYVNGTQVEEKSACLHNISQPDPEEAKGTGSRRINVSCDLPGIELTPKQTADRK